MFFGQHEVYWRSLCVGRSKIRLPQRDRRSMRALPYHLVMESSNSAWQSTHPLHHPIQCMLVDETGGWSFDVTARWWSPSSWGEASGDATFAATATQQYLWGSSHAKSEC